MKEWSKIIISIVILFVIINVEMYFLFIQTSAKTVIYAPGYKATSCSYSSVKCIGRFNCEQTEQEMRCNSGEFGRNGGVYSCKCDPGSDYPYWVVNGQVIPNP